MSKTKDNMPNVGEQVEHLEFSYITGTNVRWIVTLENSMGALKKVNTCPTLNPTIPRYLASRK
jgi:hypothetical protein